MNQEEPVVPEPNVAITGDEARLLMASLGQCMVSVPAMATLSLYNRLMEISQVQPPRQQQ